MNKCTSKIHIMIKIGNTWFPLMPEKQEIEWRGDE